MSLVYSVYFDRITDAIAYERQVKGWSRAKKEALIRGEYDLLPELSKRSSSLGDQNHSLVQKASLMFRSP